MEQAERAAEQIDARGHQRRPHAVIVEHERLDEVVEMALVIRDVDDAATPRGVRRMLDVLGHPAHLAQDRIERMLQRAVEAVPLRRAELDRGTSSMR